MMLLLSNSRRIAINCYTSSALVEYTIVNSGGVDISTVCSEIPANLLNIQDATGTTITTLNSINGTTCFPIDPLFYGTGFNSQFDLPPTSTSSSSSSKVCFAGSETVTLESGSIVPISDIRVGDRVLAADASGVLSYSDVIAVPHQTNDIAADFVELGTASGRTIKLTPEHMILAGTCGESSDFGLLRAEEVVVGSCLRTIDGLDTVQSTSLTKATGLYTIVTMEDMVVVNGIVASPFAVSHTIGNAFYSLYRGLYSIVPSLVMSKAFVAMHQSFSHVIMSV